MSRCFLLLIFILEFEISFPQEVKKTSEGLELNIASARGCLRDGSHVVFILEVKNNNSYTVRIPGTYRVTSAPGEGVGNITFELVYLSEDTSSFYWGSSQCVFGKTKSSIDLAAHKSHLFGTELVDLNFIRKGNYKIRFYTQRDLFYSNLPDISTDWVYVNIAENLKW